MAFLGVVLGRWLGDGVVIWRGRGGGGFPSEGGLRVFFNCRFNLILLFGLVDTQR